MIKIVNICILIIFSLPAIAADTASVEGVGSIADSAKLPICVDDAATIERIKEHMKANKKKPTKYDKYQEALVSDSTTQKFARLLYAEILATNCSELNEQVASQASIVIGNRIRKRMGGDRTKEERAVKSVVFERDQFASSMNNYEGSKMLEFLCPKDRVVWGLAYRKAQDQLARTTSSEDFNYYLYKHKEGWNKAPWDYPENRAGASEELRACIKIFTNPAWK